jgi:tetratricopeptide (TPR) repeat protein
MRVDQGEPESEEDVDFRETLEQFKQGIAANLDVDDFQAHYDLGIAFKEMGLLDEAIAQFQKALRAPGGKLKSSEALGVAFFEKGRYAIAETVLSRAIDSLAGGDDEKIGLLYWLGRTRQEEGRVADALRCFERALAVDITFLDLSDRIQRLTAERLS